MGVTLDFFFDSTAKTLVIYREFRYFSRIFPTLFSQLISICTSLLHTFSMGVKIDARLPTSERFASIMRSGVILRPPVSAGVLEPLEKMGGTPGLKKVKELVCSKRDHSHFCNGSNTPARAAGGGKNATTHNGGEPFTPGKSRSHAFTSHSKQPLIFLNNHHHLHSIIIMQNKNKRK